MRRLLPALPLLIACAAQQGPASGTLPSNPARTEVVVDEALVVRADRPGPRRDEHGLPPLPQALSATSESFQRGHAQALTLLTAPGPEALTGGDEAAYEAWTRGPFTDWMGARSAQTKAAVAQLAAVQRGPASEHVVAAALVGLIYTRLKDQLTAIPPPPHLATDPLLARHYQKGLDDVSAEWRKAAQGAFFHCAKYAAEQTDGAFGLWLELCHEQLASLDVARKEAAQRATQLAAETAAARLAAAGAPPPGPEICWKPHSAQPALVPTVVNAAGDDRSSAGRSCALPDDLADDDAAVVPIGAQSARDALYGVRDGRTGVRLSVATEPLPSMDLRPLSAAAPHAALTACFAQHVPTAREVTVALHASVSVDARGFVTGAQLAAEPSDAASAPGRALDACLRKALQALRFPCSPSGQPTQGKALLCFRRD